jgi:hypothetical protein
MVLNQAFFKHRHTSRPDEPFIPAGVAVPDVFKAPHAQSPTIKKHVSMQLYAMVIDSLIL